MSVPTYWFAKCDNCKERFAEMDSLDDGAPKVRALAKAHIKLNPGHVCQVWEETWLGWERGEKEP